jgi:hypothetical protein
LTKDDDAVYVVRHDDEGIQFRGVVVVRDLAPALLHDLAKVVETHGPVHDFTEESCAGVRADGDIVGP